MNPVPDVRSDTLGLFDYVHSAYALNAAREKGLRNIKAWLLYRFWIGIFTLIVTCIGAQFVWPDGQWFAIGLVLLAVIGRIGAIISVTNRMQKATSNNILDQDPIFELVALGLGRNGIRIAMLSGSVFALLIYALFATGTPDALGLQGGLAPVMADNAARQKRDDVNVAKVQAYNDRDAANMAASRLKEGRDNLQNLEFRAGLEKDQAEKAGLLKILADRKTQLAALEKDVQKRNDDATRSAAAVGQAASKLAASSRTRPADDLWMIDQLARALGLASSADVFKILIWAFIAGFAERLVPDVLDRIVARANASPPVAQANKSK